MKDMPQYCPGNNVMGCGAAAAIAAVVTVSRQRTQQTAPDHRHDSALLGSFPSAAA